MRWLDVLELVSVIKYHSCNTSNGQPCNYDIGHEPDLVACDVY